MIMNYSQNGIMNYSNQMPMNFNQNYGAYPYGYAPQMPQQQAYDSQYSPFIQPQQMQSFGGYVPGAVSPIEAQDSHGNVVKMPNTGYMAGGATINPGGFNPVTGMSSQVSVGNGYNPYTKFIGNAGYGIMPYGVPANPSQTPFNQGVCNPYIGYSYGRGPSMNVPYGYGMGYPQNQFDLELNDILYNEDPSTDMDVRGLLESIILTDEEREKIDHRRSLLSGVSRDFYGNPIYGQNAYAANIIKQQQFEEQRKSIQDHFTMLSRIAHAYTGEKIDEEAKRKQYDPAPPRQQQTAKLFNFYTATEEEKKEYLRNLRIEQCKELARKSEIIKYNENILMQRKAQMYDQIKASHDRLIGVEPGEHYDLKTFMENGYKILSSIATKKARVANRNGTTKYSRNNFRGNLSQRTNTPVPVTSKDDEYVPIEQILARAYAANKDQMSILKRKEDGGLGYMNAPVNTAEEEAHIRFLKNMELQRHEDDARKAVQ